MSRGWRLGSRFRRRPVSEAEREQAVEEYRRAVLVLQHSGFQNLRAALANATIFFAFISAWMVTLSDVNWPTLVPMSTAVIGKALGVGYYAAQDRPLGRHLLAGAVVLSALGLTGFVVARKVFGQ